MLLSNWLDVIWATLLDKVVMGSIILTVVIGILSLLMLASFGNLIRAAYREGKVDGLTLARRLILSSDKPLKDIDDILSEEVQKDV